MLRHTRTEAAGVDAWPHRPSLYKRTLDILCEIPRGEGPSRLVRFEDDRIESTMAMNAGTLVEPLLLTEAQVQSIAKALADPRRYEILRTLGEREYATACNDLLSCVDVTAATLSHHMKELEAAGLVRSEKAGKFVRYYAQRQILRAYLDRVQSDLA